MNIKNALTIIALLMVFGCRKGKEMSQEEKERSEPLLSHQIIEDEKGGLSFYLTSPDADISVAIYKGTIPIPVNQHSVYKVYQLPVDNMEENTEYMMELQFHSVVKSGTFDLRVEGFTASTNTKKFTLLGNPVSISDQGTKKKFMRFTRGVVKYSFYML